jgi:hypothetical protein
MRLTSVYSVTCSCGQHHEWDDSINWKTCPCGKTLIVKAWPNDPLLTLAAGEESA